MKKMAKEGGIAGSIAVISLFLQTLPAQAQTLTNPLGSGATFTTVMTAVAGFLFWDVASPLATIMILVGAFQLITSAGDPEKISKGKKTIVYAAVGLVIALLAGGAADIIRSFLSGASS